MSEASSGEGIHIPVTERLSRLKKAGIFAVAQRAARVGFHGDYLPAAVVTRGKARDRNVDKTVETSTPVRVRSATPMI